MIYLFIVPAMFLLLITAVELYSIKKHDRILYKYCQLRRNILSLFREQGLKLNEEDNNLLMEISEYVDITIHEFRYMKTEIFNIRNAKKLINKSASATKVNNSFFMRDTSNKDVLKIQKQLKYCLIDSAIAYTPFLRSQIIYYLLLRIAELLAKLGVTKAKNMVIYLFAYKKGADWYAQPEHQYNIFSRY